MSNAAPASAVDVACHALSILGDRNPAALAILLSENAVMDFPYAPDGFTQRLEGRDEIISGLKVVPQFFAKFVITPRKVMATIEGDVIIEADGAAVLHDGAPYRNNYVMIFEIRDGLIRRWSEYHNPQLLPGVGR